MPNCVSAKPNHLKASNSNNKKFYIKLVPLNSIKKHWRIIYGWLKINIIYLRFTFWFHSMTKSYVLGKWILDNG